jgi:hypothetical protein
MALIMIRFDSPGGVPYQRSMRAVLILAAAAAITGGVAGCDPVKPVVDGDGGIVDAGIDAPFTARECEADRPMPEEPTSAGELEGAWRLVWDCTQGCVLRRPGLTYSPVLEVAGSTLRFSNARCPDCKQDITGVITLDGCIDIVGWADFDSQCRFGYRVCEMDGKLHGTVTWKEPGVSEQVWEIRGYRPVP